MTVIDEYLNKIDPKYKPELERIRKIARRVVWEAEDSIFYGMPTIKYKGKPFLGFDIHKSHIGIYPYGGEEIERLKDKLKDNNYEFSKGAIRIPFDNPIPECLLREIIELRVKRIKI